MSDNSTTNFSPSTRITLAFLMSLLAFAIMVGNALVIIAFVVDKNLRHRSNYFFLNLAISDFFVGMISIPLYIPYTLFNWNFGDKICTFWLLTDYLLCTASVYNIVLISYDRYQSVSNAILTLVFSIVSVNLVTVTLRVTVLPLKTTKKLYILVQAPLTLNSLDPHITQVQVSYRTRHTGIWRIVAMMVGVWVLAFLVYGPVILVSDSWKNEKKNCEPGFLSEWYILAITSFLEFLVPVFSVAYFNMYIYCHLWKRGNLSRRQRYPGLTSVSSINCGDSLSMSRVAIPEPREAAKSSRSERQGRKNSLLLSLRNHMNRGVVASKMSSLHHSDSVALRQREHLELLKAKKLAGSLAILSGVFIICWAPYSLFTIIRSIYPRDQHPKSIGYEITFWLQWFNSFVNPFLYPLCHKHFQKAFLKIFCIKKPPVPSHSQLISS